MELAQATLFAPTDAAFAVLIATYPELGVFANTSELAAALVGYHSRWQAVRVARAVEALALGWAMQSSAP
jgi:hypothetical protein